MYARTVVVDAKFDATGTQDITFSGGTSFTPKIAICQWSRHIAGNDTFYDGFSFGYGFTNGTAQRCICCVSEDSVASADCSRAAYDNQLIAVLPPSGSLSVIDGVASFQEWLTNGMRINWTNVPGAAFKITVTFLGGDDITNVSVGTVAATTGASCSVSGLGYQPEWGMFLCAGLTASNSVSVSAPICLSMGAVDVDLNQWCQTWHHADAAGSDQARQYYSHSRCVTVNTTTLDGYSALGSWNSGGFTLNNTDAYAASYLIYYLVGKGGSVKVGNNTEPAGTGNQVITTSKDVKAAMVLGVNAGTADTITNGCSWSSGMCASYDLANYSQTSAELYASDPTATCCRQDTNAIYVNVTPNATAASSTIDDEASITAMTSTTFTMNWSNIGQARPYRFISFGTGVLSITKTHTQLWDIRRRITDTNTLIQHIRISALKTNTLRQDIRKALTDTNTIKLDIRQELTDTNTLLLNILQEVIKENQVLFDVTVGLAVTKTLTLLLNLEHQPVKTLLLLQDILVPIIDSNTLKYDIRDFVESQDIRLLYQIREARTKTNIFRSDIRHETPKSNTLRYSIVEEITKTNTLIQNILTFFTSNTRTFIYDIREPVSKSNILRQEIREETIPKSETLRYAITEEIIKTNSLPYNIFQHLESSPRSLLFNIFIPMATPKQLTTIFDILQQYVFISFTKRNTDSDITGMQDLTTETGTDTSLQVIIPSRTSVYHEFVTPVNEIDKTDWENGTYTWRYRITTAAANCSITEVYLQRRSSDGTTVRASKSSGTISVDISTTGVKSGTIVWDDGTQNPAGREPDDRLEITFVLYNNHNSQSRTLESGYNLDGEQDEITTPLRQYFATQITKPLTMLFHLREDMTKPTTLLADIKQISEKINTFIYHLRAKAEKQLVTRFDEIGQPIKSLTMPFDVRQEIAVAATFSLLFSIKQMATNVLSLLYDTRQETPKSLTLIQRITEDVQLINSLLFDVRHSLTKTNTILHEVKAEASQTTALRFEIIQQIAKISELIFNIEIIFEGHVTKSLDLKFHVSQMALESLSLLFNELQQITDTNTLIYDIKQKAEKENIFRHDIRQGVQDITTLIAHIRKTALKTETLPFAIRTYIEKSNTLINNISRRILAKQSTTKFNIDHQVTRQRRLLFNLEELGKVLRTLTIITEIWAPMPTPKQTALKFNVNEIIDKSNTLVFKIWQKAIKQGVFNYSVRGTTTDTTRIKFNITNLVEKQRSIVFKTCESIATQNSLIFQILKGVRLPVSLKYQIISQPTKSNNIRFHIREFLSKSITLDQAIYQKAQTDVTVRFDFLHEIGKTLSVMQNIMMELESQHELLFRVTQEVPALDTTIKYDIIAQTTKLLRTLYDIRQVFEWSRSLVFNVYPRGLTPKLTLHEKLLDHIITHWEELQPSHEKIRWHEWYNGQADITIDSVLYNHFTIESKSTQIYKERNYSAGIHIFYRDYSDLEPEDRNIPVEMARVINEVQRILLTSRYAFYSEVSGINIYEIRIRDAKFVPDPANSESSSMKVLHYRFIVEMLYQKLVF